MKTYKIMVTHVLTVESEEEFNYDDFIFELSAEFTSGIDDVEVIDYDFIESNQVHFEG